MSEATLDIQPEVAVEPVDTTPQPEVESTATDQVENTAQEVQVEEATPSIEEPKEEAPKKSGFQKRIDELTRQRYEVQAQLEQFQRENEQLRQFQIQQQIQGTEPKIEDYDYDHDQWSNAYKTWVNESQKKAAEQQKQLDYQAQLQQQQALQHQKLQEKVFQAQAQFPNFIETINDPSLPQLKDINEAAYEAVIESDNMGAVAMHLAKNPEKVYALGSLTPVQAIKEIARLEAALAAQPQSPKPPPPPPASDMRSVADAKIDPTKLPTGKYIEWRNAQLAKKGK